MAGRIAVLVTKAWDAAEGIRALELTPQDGGAFVAGAPGGHIDLHLPNGLVRQYSLCNGPAETGFYRIAVKREPASRGGSAFVHDGLKPGDLLEIGAPRNNFPLAQSDGFHLLLGGGIGITPLLAMARHLVARGAKFHLYYFVRAPASAAFREILESGELRASATILAGLDADATQAALVRTIAAAGPSAHVYTCGPAPFMDVALSLARAAGLAEHLLHKEYFSAPADAVPLTGGRFRVEAKRSGIVVDVDASETIVAALARQGIDVPVSCEQGVCGTCLTPVLDGVPDHRDMYLTDDEKARNDRMCLCVSRANSPSLTLDI